MNCNWHSLSKFHNPCTNSAVIKDQQGIYLCEVHFRRLLKKAKVFAEEIEKYLIIEKPVVEKKKKKKKVK